MHMAAYDSHAGADIGELHLTNLWKRVFMT